MTDSAVYDAARMYYEQNRSQQEIAAALGVSRSTVSRLLSEARRTGVVRIEVVAPSQHEELARRLADTLGLHEVFLTRPAAGHEPPWSALASATSDVLRQTGLAHGDVLLVSWGRTMWEIAQHRLCALEGVLVAPTMGGLHEPKAWFQTNEIVRLVSKQVGGEMSLLHAPAQPSPALRRELERDEATTSTLRLWDRAQAALLGIGGPPAALGDYGPAQHPRDRDALQRAAGDVASRYFDSDGRPVRYADEQRLLGISREQLLRIPHKIAVASGTHKAASIMGAARAKLVDVLVTDIRTADAVLARADTG